MVSAKSLAVLSLLSVGAMIALGVAYKTDANMDGIADGESLQTLDEICALVDNPSDEVTWLCNDMAGTPLDEEIGCGEGVNGTIMFTLRSILGADDVQAAYDDTMNRCISEDTEGEDGAGRQLWTIGDNYGWCSMSLNFVSKGWIPGGAGDGSDTANYCDASQTATGDSWERSNALSLCCEHHDMCLTDGDCGHGRHNSGRSRTANNRYGSGVTPFARNIGCECDEDLGNCAWYSSCQKPEMCWGFSCDWRGCIRRDWDCSYYSPSCATAKGVVWGIMGKLLKPNC